MNVIVVVKAKEINNLKEIVKGRGEPSVFLENVSDKNKLNLKNNSILFINNIETYSDESIIEFIDCFSNINKLVLVGNLNSQLKSILERGTANKIIENNFDILNMTEKEKYIFNKILYGVIYKNLYDYEIHDNRKFKDGFDRKENFFKNSIQGIVSDLI